MKLLSVITIATAVACASGAPPEPPAICDAAEATLASYWCSLPWYPPRCTGADAVLASAACCEPGFVGCGGGGVQPGQRLLRKQNVA